MVLHHHVGALALAPHVRVEIGGDHAPHAGLAEQDLGIGPEVEVLCAKEALSRPLAIRPIVEADGVTKGGDGDRPVLAVIGDRAGCYRPRPVGVIAERVAIGVIGDGRVYNTSNSIRMLRQINQHLCPR
ncbi:MAG: hypothetical protein WCN98_10640 [Verrucomicrobiaceae bacterium]